jgi:hypothetical protein
MLFAMPVLRVAPAPPSFSPVRAAQRGAAFATES